MFISKTLKFYKREDIQEVMLQTAEDKEVAVIYGEKGFGKRPDTLQYKDDILEHAKRGATSFHCSEETWFNPLQIDRNLKPQELEQLRKAWDLVLDIDCKLLDYSKIAAHYTVKVLKHYGIKSITCKFSGNKGFHIAVPFESFPEKIGGVETKNLFPEAPRRIAAYIKHLIKEPVSNAILKLEKNDFGKIVKKTGMKAEDIIRFEINEFGDKIEKLNAEPFLDIDTVLISSRHLFRMPYSFHEKSQLVSIPVNPDKVLSFKKEDAEPENVVVKEPFLDRNAEKNESSKLIIQAFDFEVKKEEVKLNESKHYEDMTEAIPEHLFPPCIHNIFKGLEDGRKRSVFILSNFLSSAGWSKEQIEERLEEWNKHNKGPLKEVHIKGQLRYKTQRKETIPPPNCDNKGYYIGMRVCKPDSLCGRIKNPIQYAKIKAKEMSKNRPKETKVRNSKQSEETSKKE
ncbi:MAG: DNA primase small subunit domain-containing protein [archaeon]